MVKVFDMIQDRGKLYMVMELIEGKTLEQYVNDLEHEKLSMKTLLQILK